MIKQIFLAFFSSLFFVILFNIDRRKLIWAGLCGAIAWGTYLLVFNYSSSPIMATFIGAFAVGLYSEFMAKRFRAPASAFSIPGIFPLVPGLAAYTTVKHFVEKNNELALTNAIQTLIIGGAIGFGIMLAAAIVRLLSKSKSN
jgi:uncharacterized membrane protein YjjB (DUF3815 family)